MANLWHWIALNWGPLGIGTCIGGAFSLFVWFIPNRKEWKVERQEKAEKRLDSKVLNALADQSLWKGPRPMTGAGILAVRSAEIAQHLKMDNNLVADSLERLADQGRASNQGGTLDNPSPYWLFVPR